MRDLIEANSRLKESPDMKPWIRYQSPKRSTNSEVTVWSFSDASFNISSSESYGETGTVSGLLFDADRGRNGHIFHPIDWHSSKQRRVSHS